jgi:hypothetical protein
MEDRSMAFYVKDVFEHPGRYRKFWVCVVGAGISILTILFGPDNPYLVVLVEFLTLMGVFAAPNDRMPL